MFYPPFDFEQIVEASLAALDAEMSAQAFIQRANRLWLGRQELTPGLLVGYRVSDENGWTKYGECGWIVLQHLDSHRTLMSFKVTAPTAEDREIYLSIRSTPMPENLSGMSVEQIKAWQVYHVQDELYQKRKTFLQNLCASISEKVTKLVQPGPTLSQPKAGSNLPVRSGGRPGLPDDEKLRRLALVILERKLKQIDPGLTHGEFAFQVQQKLKIPLEEHTIRNAAKLLERAQKNQEHELLSQAESLAAKWQSEKW